MVADEGSGGAAAVAIAAGCALSSVLKYACCAASEMGTLLFLEELNSCQNLFGSFFQSCAMMAPCSA